MSCARRRGLRRPLTFDFVGCWGRCWPGCAPGGAVTFFLSRQKESNQRKRRPHWPCPSASLRATCDARAWGGAAELALFAALTPLKHPQQVRARSAACCAAAPAPRPALLGTARGEGKSTRAIAALGLGLVGAAASRGASSCSLSRWRERVGVRVNEFKNHSCLRPSPKYFRSSFLEPLEIRAQATMKIKATAACDVNVWHMARQTVRYS